MGSVGGSHVPGEGGGIDESTFRRGEDGLAGEQTGRHAAELVGARKALVLGGGGITGIAWMLGLLAGWREAGLDVADADLVVGTSAGSVVGAQLATGCDLGSLYERELAGRIPERTAVSLWRFLWLTPRLLVSARSARGRARIGRAALRAATRVSERQARAIMAARLPVHTWPSRRLLVTAVDADTGELHAFEGADGVPLVDVVTASCAVPGVWPPITVAGRRWMDGGMRSVTNADLAVGYERVLVVAPIPVGLARQTRALRHRGRVSVVVPDRQARRAIGRNPLDPARGPVAARAGHAQAATTYLEVSAFWPHRDGGEQWG